MKVSDLIVACTFLTRRIHSFSWGIFLSLGIFKRTSDYYLL